MILTTEAREVKEAEVTQLEGDGPETPIRTI
jgi:hypothetical protein